MTRHYTDIAEQSHPVEFAGLPYSQVRRSVFYRVFFKRALDTLLVLMAMPIVLPVIALLSVMIWLRDFKNPFYIQDRVGLGGEPFKMVKLRSMVVNADQELEQYLNANPVARKEWDDKQKLVEDPRITSFGSFLRRSSLDELPQLLNVLVGHMSLVGPRPMMPQQKVLYPGHSYYKLRPGITGPWQISDRHQTAFSARAKFDNVYFRNVSFTTDVRILFKTLKVVARGTGC